MNWIIANSHWLIPLVLYIAVNVVRRDYLVKNENAVIRGIAHALEMVLVLEWDRWGGSFKPLGLISPRVEDKKESGE